MRSLVKKKSKIYRVKTIVEWLNMPGILRKNGKKKKKEEKE